MHTVQKTIVGAQFLFVAFGATVLVPLLIGLEPSVALFTAGVGTLIFHAVTKGKVPILKAFDWRFVWNNRNRTCIRDNEPSDSSSRCHIHYTTLCTCSYWPSNYVHRTFIARDRRGCGQEQPASCHHCASDNSRRSWSCCIGWRNSESCYTE